ncbi:MAG TPA: ferric reductase-like transmembrane domain-containing protein [Acidimicrobiia bacterium]
MSTQLWWYAARAAGIVAWVLLAAGVLWGLALSTKVFGRKPRPAWLLDLHRALGGLAVIFTAVHVAAVMLDSYVHFGIAEVLVPLASSWHPVAVAWGIVGLYLLLAVELTSLARRHLSKRMWRAIHFASFPLFVVATVHGLSAGTDTKTGVAIAVVAVVVAAVTSLTAVRVRAAVRDAPGAGEARLPAQPRPRPVRPAAAAAPRAGAYASRCTMSGEKAGRQMATYSAPRGVE